MGSILDMDAVTYRLSKARDAQTNAGTRPPPLLSLKLHDLQTDRRTDRQKQEDRQTGCVQNVEINIEGKKTEDLVFKMKNELLVTAYSRQHT